MKKIVLFTMCCAFAWSCTKDKADEPTFSSELAISPAKTTNIVFGEKVRLTAVASASKATCGWMCGPGGFVGLQTSKTIEWQAPDSVGTFEVKSFVTDGKDTVFAKVNLEVVGYFFDDFNDASQGWTADSIANRRPSGGTVVVEPQSGANSTNFGYTFGAVSAPFSYKTSVAIKDSANFPLNGYFHMYTTFAAPAGNSQPYVSNLYVNVYPLASINNCRIRIYTYNPANQTGIWSTLVNWVTVPTISVDRFKNYAVSITGDKKLILYINGRKEIETLGLQQMNFSGKLGRFYYYAYKDMAVEVDNFYLTTDGTIYK